MSTEMDSELITQADIDKSMDGYLTLGPAYFAARRVAEGLMANADSSPFQSVAKKCIDEITQSVYAYVEDRMRDDIELNLQGYIRDMVERTVRALLTGEEWAMKQYPLAQYHDGEKN